LLRRSQRRQTGGKRDSVGRPQHNDANR
jgi:hypothetical protein